MPLDELKDASLWTGVGVFLTGCAEYVWSHPVTAASSSIMLVVAWDRLRRSRIKTKTMQSKLRKAKQEESLMEQKAEDWKRRFEEYKKEEDNLTDES